MAKANSSSIVAKCAVVIDAITDARHPLTFVEIVAATGFVKSSCHRILGVLKSEELVHYDVETRTYHAGPRIRTWARASWQRTDLQDIAASVMDKLADDTGLNAALTILDDRHVMYLRTSGNVPVRLAARAGDRAPLHCTAAGKLFLAHMGPKRRADLLTAAPLEKFTEHTKTDLEVLAVEFDTIVRQRYALAIKEEYLHVLGSAAPIRDEAGALVACLSLWCLTDNTSLAYFRESVPQVVAAAAHVSNLLGWDARQDEMA